MHLARMFAPARRVLRQQRMRVRSLCCLRALNNTQPGALTMPSRDEAIQLLNEWVPNAGLRAHMKSVEAAVRFYARKFGEDEEAWGLAGLLHDLDWEKYPEEHPLRAVEELRGRGYDESILHAILAHRADFTGVAPESQLDKTLLACD